MAEEPVTDDGERLVKGAKIAVYVKNNRVVVEFEEEIGKYFSMDRIGANAVAGAIIHQSEFLV